MVPKLRFKNSKPWHTENLFGLAVNNTLSNGVFNDPMNTGCGYKLINVVNMYKEPFIDENDLTLLTLDEKTFYKNKVNNGDIFFTRSSLVKEGIAWSNIYLGNSEDVTYDGHLIKMVPNQKKVIPQFLHYCLKTSQVRNQLIKGGKTATMTTIGQLDVGKISLHIPSLNDQTKIADFFSAVDEKITLLNNQYQLLCQYKKGMMQKIFGQKFRFKCENGKDYPEWEIAELKEIASKVNEKNRDNSVSTVLTNSATQGIVSQQSYFERDIVTESNLTGYYVVNVGDFVYNPRISATAPVGPIKMNELIKGIMSPLYTVFRFNQGSLKFYQYFFESSVWHDYMKSIANSGARHDRMNISGADFLALPMPQPIEKEQTKIANFLSAIDEKITIKKAELDKLKTWKQGLLQQMFV